MLLESQKRDKACIIYNNEPLECVESFKYLGLEVPSNHRWNECAARCLEAGKRAYYAFENTCDRGDIKCWVLKKYLFDTLVTPVLLYGVEVWGGSIPNSTWKEFEHVQIHFLIKFTQVKKQTTYTLLLLETGSLPIEITTMERVVKYMLKVQKCPSLQLPRIAWKASKKIQNTHKTKMLCSSWMQDMEKWDTTHLIHDTSLDFSVS